MEQSVYDGDEKRAQDKDRAECSGQRWSRELRTKDGQQKSGQRWIRELRTEMENRAQRAEYQEPIYSGEIKLEVDQRI